MNHCLWPLKPHFTTPEGKAGLHYFLKKIKVNFFLNSPSKVPRRSNHLLTNPPTTFFLMLTRDLHKFPFDISPHTEVNGESDLQKVALITLTKDVSFPGKEWQPPSFFKVSSLERECNMLLYLLIHWTNTQ